MGGSIAGQCWRRAPCGKRGEAQAMSCVTGTSVRVFPCACGRLAFDCPA